MSDQRKQKILGADDHEASGNYTERLILLSKHVSLFLGFVAVTHVLGSVLMKDQQ